MRPVLIALALALVVLALPADLRAASPTVVLGTTVGLQRSGLLDALLPAFEQASGRTVTVVGVSAPQALSLGVRGEVDVLLVDAAEDGRQYVADGHGLDRRLVMHDDRVVLGPRSDPAAVRGAEDAGEALRRIAAAGWPWVSRADNSGLYQFERKLWREAGVEPAGQGWYVGLGQGMAAALYAASERQGYILAERAAYLEARDRLDLDVVAQGFPDLLNPYHVIVVNPAKGAWLDGDGARALADFLLAPAAQETIGQFAADRFGEPIFTPDAGRSDADLLPASGR